MLSDTNRSICLRRGDHFDAIVGGDQVEEPLSQGVSVRISTVRMPDIVAQVVVDV